MKQPNYYNKEEVYKLGVKDLLDHFNDEAFSLESEAREALETIEREGAISAERACCLEDRCRALTLLIKAVIDPSAGPLYTCDVCGLTQANRGPMQAHEDRCIKQRDCAHAWEYNTGGNLTRRCQRCDRVDVIAAPDDSPDAWWDYVGQYPGDKA